MHRLLLPIAVSVVLLNPTAGAYADPFNSGGRWAPEDAMFDAARVVATNEPFLYSSGGFVCSPKYDTSYRTIAVKLPKRPLGCGCVITGSSMQKSAYARIFNNEVLALLQQQRLKNSD